MIVVVIVMVMMMLMLVVIVVVIIAVMMMVAFALGIVALLAVMVMVVVMMLVLVLIVVVMVLLVDLVHVDQRLGRLDGLEDHVGGQLVPRRGDDARGGILLTQHCDVRVDLVLAGHLRAAEDNRLGAAHLIAEELAEILHIHFAFARVHDGHAAGEHQLVLLFGLRHDMTDVAKLAHAGRLDDQPVGMILLDQLVDRLGEIAHQRAADAAGVHLGHGNAAVLHEAAVNADLAVFVFKQNDLLVLHRAAKQLFNQRRLTGAQKTGNNVDLDHNKDLLCTEGRSAPFPTFDLILPRGC